MPEPDSAIDEIIAGTTATHALATDRSVPPQGAGSQEASNQQSAAAKGPIDPANQLSQYREQLAKDMQRQGLAAKNPSSSPATHTKRVSPILEESIAGSPGHIVSGPATASTNVSTESGHTIRGGVTPGLVPRTPSYPFPRVTTPGYQPSPMHRPFTTLSPTGKAPDSPLSTANTATYGNSRAQDQMLSNPSTPASAASFLPSGVAYSPQPEITPDIPTPNLYDLSLMLTSEPGLDAWWRTVVHIMTAYYRAERLTLSVPADSTDLENIPWGQKATYNARQEDNFSMEYMAMSSSAIPSTKGDFSGTPSTPGLDAFRLQVPLRPKLPTRHSFGSYEEEKQKKTAEKFKAPAAAAAAAVASSKRPGLFTRSQSFFPVTPHSERPRPDDVLHMGLNQQALAEHDAEEPKDIENWPVPAPERENTGRMFELLQALDYEADPLIDHHGVAKVLERGRVIALTRSYPYLEESAPSKSSDTKVAGRNPSPEGSKKKGKKFRPEASAKLSSILSSAQSMKMHSHERRTGQQNIDQMISEGEPRRPPTPTYEEFEQAPPSPWSQSPAPSPAIRAEQKENPFFSSSTVDESCFDPTTGTPDYATMGPPEAIGMDNAWTVLHIPLRHPLLSKVSNGFKLDPKVMEQKSSRFGKPDSAESGAFLERENLREEKPMPIAILSILSSTIPYPSNLRYSLEHLAPHLATSLSLCRHYSTLESEVTRMHRRKPRISGFGAVDADGRPIADPAILQYSSEDVQDHSLAGSLTSPSEYSVQSRSAAGTPGGTPGWEMSGFGVHVDKRPAIAGTVPAPAAAAGDSYFTTKTKAPAKPEASSTAQQRPRRGSKDSPSSDKRSSLRLYELLDSDNYSGEAIDSEAVEDTSGKAFAEEPSSTSVQRKGASREQSDIKEDRAAEIRSVSKLENMHRHRKLHSHGGDFATTFQSLPPGASIPTGPPQPRGDTTITHPPEMAWPTDRLKDLILDSLPAQLFVATVPAGGIVWVNSRYIAYRGQTLAELYADPHASIHPDDRGAYLSDWGRAVRTGEDFQMTVRIRRFDGAYRCFSARVVACRNRRNEIVYYLGSYTDIHEQTMAELKVVRQQEIEASEAKHRLLANLIPQIIFTATEDEGITFSNEQWLSYTGQSEEDALGLGFMDYVHPDDLARCQIPSGQHPPATPAGDSEAKRLSLHSDSPKKIPHHALSRNNSSSSESIYGLPAANLTELARAGVVKIGRDSSGRLTYTTEIRLRSRAGEYRWHLVRCVEIENTGLDNGVSSYFGSATDINDHKLLEAKLKEAMESKSRFLSNMSHEIRTPLIGISGMVSFLQDTKLNEEQRDYTNTIQTSANSLLMIINDILDLSKVDAGMMKLNHEWFHTRALIEDVNELVSAMAIARRLELNYIVDEDVPTYVKGDRVRIRQVLLNVIGNAIKFTDTGEVFSRCTVKRGAPGLEQNQVMLEFAVIDTGRGFTEEERKLIFKPFSQIDGSSTRAHGGSGLGLVISRQLVELHGGMMEGTAVLGKGATFTFTAKFGLPTDEDHPAAPASPLVVATPATIEEIPTQPFRQLSLKPRSLNSFSTMSPGNATHGSPTVASSGSSNPSITSTGTRLSDRSSFSSVNVGLARFSEAARASGQDLSQMKLEMPSGRNSPGRTATDAQREQIAEARGLHPPMFSILVICPQKYSCEATTRHIEMTLPKDVPHQITALHSAEEAEALIGRNDPVIFTHIIINLFSVEEIIHLLHRINNSTTASQTSVILLSDSIQRQDLTRLVADTQDEELISDGKLKYVYKPVKPSRLAVIFDPTHEGDASVDRNRSTAQQLVEDQKKSYQEVEKRMGNKGYQVLLVEDNPVNQKVLKKYLAKVGVAVDLAMDGEECTNKVFSHPHGFYSLILCDLHMPRKDGYQACREIREWENKNKFKALPIIALSANVMSDVQEKCVEAGFSDYVTKPVDFINLSTALSKFF
ncbi:hypothetical protein BD289DRAFT_370269 [Coniella lustricola]|uniref:histidine kinase n=1 Tax=Coniella lustricola TaxID=2025994 RepID=A0A2T3A5H7_9PEZI|nr:hypothetical protein BD289DRAFT_370269 [Coniella lustricola]